MFKVQGSRFNQLANTIIVVGLLFCAANASAQKTAPMKPFNKKKVDPVLPVLKRAQEELAAGNAEAARKSYEEAFGLDRYHRHDKVNVALATFFLDDRIQSGTTYDLTREQLIQRFLEVPYLAEGFCHVHRGDKDGARHAWHKIIEWRSSDELVQYLHELQLADEVMELKTDLGIDSGTGIAARKNLEDRYKKEGKWEGAFQLARRHLLEIPVEAGLDARAEYDRAIGTCIDYFFKQSDPDEGLRRLAEDIHQRTRDHQRALEQILETQQISRTSLAKAHKNDRAEALLRDRIAALEDTAVHLETLAEHPETPIAAEGLSEEPPENRTHSSSPSEGP